jgi:hypothetical protein
LASSGSAWSSPAPGCYKQELDPEGLPQFSLGAEQVEHVKPDLAARDEDGKVSTVRYETVNAMLLNKFLRRRASAFGIEEFWKSGIHLQIELRLERSSSRVITSRASDDTHNCEYGVNARQRLTRTRSATAGESGRRLQSKYFHKVKRGCPPVRRRTDWPWRASR